MLTDIVINKVNAKNTDLVQGLMSDDKEEVKSAKNSLKGKYLEEMKQNSLPNEEYYGEFYKVVKKINKQLKGSG